jgi:hypothetical protein
MFGLSVEDENALEKAAGMGIGDAEAFSFGDESDGWMKRNGATAANAGADDDESEGIDMEKISAEPDAFTVGVKEEDEYANLAQEWSDAQTQPDNEDDDEAVDDVSVKSDLSSIYEKIKANKAKASESVEMGEDSSEERKDPGFRIYHVDKETREKTEVPPFMSPGEFFQMKEEKKQSSDDVKAPSSASDEGGDTEDEPLFDGYTAIREAYGGRTTEEETAEATRSARMRNRAKTSEIDESKIGAMSSPGGSPPPATPSSATASPPAEKYEKVRSEKAKAWVSEMNGSTTEGTDDSLDSDEKTLDGYQAIMSANAASSREEELAKMKEARMANRVKADRIDSSFKV